MNSQIIYRLNDGLNYLAKWPGIRQLTEAIKKRIYSRVEASLWNYFHTDQITGGPFQGTRFPHRAGNCSVFFPKLIGCYEAELHPVFDKLRNNDYKEVWDIGAADGFYAAGLAKMFPKARIRAWEASAIAAKNCKITCEANGVEKQVEVSGVCNREELFQITQSDRSLIVCDIERFEGELFDESTLELLSCADLVIELHEDFAPGVTEKLLGIFRRSHNVDLIDAVSDEQKVIKYNYTPLPKMNAIQRRYATAERRYRKMQWLIATTQQA